MMELLALIGGVKKMIHAIQEISSQVKANRESCLNLRDRCEGFLPALDTMMTCPPSEEFAKPLTDLWNLLIEINQFLQKFTWAESSSNLTILQVYLDLANTRRSDLSRFVDYNEKITNTVQSLSLGILVDIHQQQMIESESARRDLVVLREEAHRFFSRNSAVADLEIKSKSHNVCEELDSVMFEWSVGEEYIRTLREQIDIVEGKISQGQAVDHDLKILRRSFDNLGDNTSPFPQQISLLKGLSMRFSAIIQDQTLANTNRIQTELKTLIDQNEEFRRSLTDIQEHNRRGVRYLVDILERSGLTMDEESIRSKELSELSVDPKKVTFYSDLPPSSPFAQSPSPASPALHSPSQLSFSSSSPNSLSSSYSLGRGTFGEVKLGKYHNYNVAIKIISARQGSAFTLEEKRQIENETLLMDLCRRSPYIVAVYGYCYPSPSTAYIIMEYAHRGSLSAILSSSDRYPSLSSPLLLAWIIDISCGLQYLHSRRIVHLDIKADNVLLCEGLCCKLTDFGFAKLQRRGTLSVINNGTGEALGAVGGRVGGTFLAPEIAKGSYSRRSDIYSLGMTVIQILTRRTPSLPISLRVELLLPCLPPETSLPFKSFLMECLSENPVERPSADEAMNFFCSVLHSCGGDLRTAMATNQASSTTLSSEMGSYLEKAQANVHHQRDETSHNRSIRSLSTNQAPPSGVLDTLAALVREQRALTKG